MLANGRKLGEIVRINLNMDLLRTFVAIADAGSMVKASERVFLTQSALSLQMKRLADILQLSILQRKQGVLCLTPAGETLLVHARAILERNDRTVEELIGKGMVGPVRVGMVQDFADEILPGVLTRFSKLNPNADLQILVANSADLKEKLEAGHLHIAVYLAAAEDEASVVTAPMTWLGHSNLLDEDILPIAIMAKPCVFRDAALSRLEAAGRPYRIVVETPSISVLRPTVESGLAITCRTDVFLGRRCPTLELAGLELPKISYCVGQMERPPETITGLVELIRSAILAFSESPSDERG